MAIALSLRAPEAFAEVFDRHFHAVHRYLARRVGADAADDLTSHTFTLAFSQRGRYHDDLGTARPWLLGIATNLLRAHWRTETRRLAAIAAFGQERPVEELNAGLDPAVAAALAGLDRDQRDALLLHAWGDLTYREISATLGVPIGTVRSRISRACAALRITLTQDPEGTRA